MQPYTKDPVTGKFIWNSRSKYVRRIPNLGASHRAGITVVDHEVRDKTEGLHSRAQARLIATNANRSLKKGARQEGKQLTEEAAAEYEDPTCGDISL